MSRGANGWRSAVVVGMVRRMVRGWGIFGDLGLDLGPVLREWYSDGGLAFADEEVQLQE